MKTLSNEVSWLNFHSYKKNARPIILKVCIAWGRVRFLQAAQQLNWIYAAKKNKNFKSKVGISRNSRWIMRCIFNCFYSLTVNKEFKGQTIWYFLQSLTALKILKFQIDALMRQYWRQCASLTAKVLWKFSNSTRIIYSPDRARVWRYQLIYDGAYERRTDHRRMASSRWRRLET